MGGCTFQQHGRNLWRPSTKLIFVSRSSHPQRDIQIQNWSGFPGIEEREKFKAWLKHPGYMERWRDKAIATIQEEINAHAIPDLRPWWHRVENNPCPPLRWRFAPFLFGVPSGNSLRATRSVWAGAFALIATRSFIRHAGTGFSARPSCSSCTQNASGRKRIGI